MLNIQHKFSLKSFKHYTALCRKTQLNISQSFSSRVTNVVHYDYLQPNKVRNEVKELRMFCAEDEQSRTCWMTAFRLFKVGSGTTFHWLMDLCLFLG